MSTTVFGIDLGTTYSCISHVDQFGKAVTIPNLEGDRVTPSAVFFDGEERIVGIEAKNNRVLYDNQVVEMVKRQMGQTGWSFFCDGRDYSAEEISSYILRKLAQDAEMATGIPVTDVVITCPAYFGINEREATAKAGEIAGLNVRSIINEPTAAAIAYGLHDELDQTILVYDLGGGTFDITMIEIKKGEITVIATGGDHNLGGKDWDSALMGYLSSQWMDQTASFEDPMDDPDTVADLFGKAESAKKSLSARQQTNVAVMHAGQREKIEITRDKFDEITKSLLERTIEYTHKMLGEAKKKGFASFDKIILVGGSARMPQVAARLKAEFGMEPQLFEPDEAVAKGAALYGQVLMVNDAVKIKLGTDSRNATASEVARAQKEVADEFGLMLPSVQKYDNLTITNVTSRSFGVEVIDLATDQKIVANLIKVNDTVPTETTQQFGTYEANQMNVEIRIMENILSDMSVQPADCEEIGNAMLDVPSGLPKGSPIEVTFALDEQGRLHAKAREVTANRIIEVTIETTRIISQEQFEEAKERSQELVVT